MTAKRCRQTVAGAAQLRNGLVWGSIITAAVWPGAGARAEDTKKLDTLCKEAGARLVAAEVADEPESKYTFWADKGASVHFSFSRTISACVGSRINYLLNEWEIEDINRTFSELRGVFWCEKKRGAYNMILEAVRRYNGELANLTSDLFADDGGGGPGPYDRDKCEGLFKKKLVELRLVDPPDVP